MKPQIERHYDYELRWPIILAANVLQVRYPRMAHPLLNDELFWERIDNISFLEKAAEHQLEVGREIDGHIDKVASDLQEVLAPIQRTETKTAITRLYSQLDRWAFRDTKFLAEQMQIAEAPHAVTWKEFDECLRKWRAKPEKMTSQKWIREHAAEVDRSDLRVYTEMLDATIAAYSKSLNEANDKFVDAEKVPLEEKAETLLALLECLLFDLGDLEKTEKKIGIKQLKQLCETVASLSAAKSSFEVQLWPRTEQLLARLIELWSGDVGVLMTVIRPSDSFRFTHYEGPSVRDLHKNLCGLLLPKFATQIIRGFRQAEFVDHLIQNQDETYETRSMLLNPNGSLWKDLRSEAVRVLAEAKSDRVVQENAYQLLYWFDYQLREQKGTLQTQQIEVFLRDEQISEVIWAAATATPISARAVARMQRFPDELRKLGISVEAPVWWTNVLKEISTDVKQPPTNNDEPPLSA